MKFLFYHGRHGEQHLTVHSEQAWEYLKLEMQKDNRCSFEDYIRGYGGFDDGMISGSFEYHDDAHLSLDDGGSIQTIYLMET